MYDAIECVVARAEDGRPYNIEIGVRGTHPISYEIRVNDVFWANTESFRDAQDQVLSMIADWKLEVIECV